MTAKEYLEQLPDMRVRINAIKRKIAECMERASDTSAKISGERSGSGSRGKVEKNVEQAVDIEIELRQLVKQFEQLELRASKEICSLPTSIYSGLLFEKYINGLSWEQVAEAIGKDVDHTRKVLHSKALAEFDRLIPENTRFYPCITQP